MVNLKDKTNIFILIAGFLAILLLFIPITLWIDLEDNSTNVLFWLVGAVTVLRDGKLDADSSGFVDESGIIAVGFLFALILLIVGLFYIISVLLPKFSERKVPYKGKLWLVLGVFLIFLPQLLCLAWAGVDPESEGVFAFYANFNLMGILLAIAGSLGIISGMIELSR